jgi:hypothetical protein
MGFHSFLQKAGRPARIGDGEVVEQCDLQAHPPRRRRGLGVLAQERGACPDAAETGVMERFSTSSRSRRRRRSRSSAAARRRHRADPGQHLHPQDAVGLVRGEEPLPRALLARKGRTRDETSGSRSWSTRARCSISTACPRTRRRLQDRLRDRPALAHRTRGRPHAAHLPVAVAQPLPAGRRRQVGPAHAPLDRRGSGLPKSSTTAARNRCSGPPSPAPPTAWPGCATSRAKAWCAGAAGQSAGVGPTEDFALRLSTAALDANPAASLMRPGTGTAALATAGLRADRDPQLARRLRGAEGPAQPRHHPPTPGWA